MNVWLWSALFILLGILPCMFVMLRAGNIESVVALQCASGISVLALLLIAQGMHRASFIDIALLLALLNYPAGLLFAHFFERWL